MNKYKTNVPGLDMLFHGGLQIDNNLNDLRQTANDGNEENGIVIVIRGAKGTNKTTLAMQLMHGLFRSMQEKRYSNERINALFYSINKESDALNDSYLDMIISQLLKGIIRQYRYDTYNQERESNAIKGSEDIQAIVEFLFDTDSRIIDNKARSMANRLLKSIGDDLPKLICEGIVFYNPRTSSLHYKRMCPNDNTDNLVATRRYNTIQEYIDFLNDGSNKQLIGCEHPVVSQFVKYMMSVLFNADEKSDIKLDSPQSPMTFYQAIEADIYEKLFRLVNEDENAPFLRTPQPRGISSRLWEAIVNKKTKYEVLVIDGFSQLTNKELENLPFSNLKSQAKRLARISILVFDEREDYKCDGDIVIEMKERTAEKEEYMYHELRIHKSVFQTSVLGWHQYKKRDDGIEVFPSAHLLLSKRFYVSNKSQSIGQSLFDTSYDQYLDAKGFKDCINGEVSDCAVQASFKEYLAKHNRMTVDSIEHAFDRYCESVSSIRLSQEGKDTDKLPYRKSWEELRRVLFLNNVAGKYSHICIGDCDANHTSRSLHRLPTDHFPSTVIIGNPNSYKRTLALATAYNLALQGIHTLFFLFDKNELDMRQHMVCPAYNKSGCRKHMESCKKCCKHIHTYDVRMGCISAEEFFAILLDQINYYCSPTKNTRTETKCVHIVIDDLQKIDFSFPFIRYNELFLSALLAICHSHNVKLTVLCDKSASLTHEASSLFDTVIDIRRNIDNIYDIELSVERGGDEYIPSRIIEYKVSDILHLFSCDGKKMSLDDCCDNPGNEAAAAKSRRIEARPIGSMKEYWRKTVNNRNLVDQKGIAPCDSQDQL